MAYQIKKPLARVTLKQQEFIRDLLERTNSELPYVINKVFGQTANPDARISTFNRQQAADIINFLKASEDNRNGNNDAKSSKGASTPNLEAVDRKRNYSSADSAHRDFPINVDTASVEELITYFCRFPRPMIRVFLDAMGTPMGKHGDNANQLKLIDKHIQSNTDKARRLIKVIAQRNYDAVGNHPKAESMSQQDLDRVVEHVNKACLARVAFDTNAWSEILGTEVQKSLKLEAFESVRKAAMEEASKVQRKDVHIKLNGAASKKVDGIVPDEFETIVGLASVRQNILLTGPSGCGKTHIAGKLADVLDLEYGSVSCSVGMSESHLAGWLLPVGKGGTFAHVPTAFVECYEQGGVFLFDELDAADENTLLFVNTALANDGFHLSQRVDNPWVAKHKDFVCVAAANTMGNGESTMYSGRNILDGATMDRFRAGVVCMDYSDEVERSLIDSEILAWGKQVREVIRSHNYDRILSTRVMLDFTKQKEMLGWGLNKFKASYFADWSEAEISAAGSVAQIDDDEAITATMEDSPLVFETGE